MESRTILSWLDKLFSFFVLLAIVVLALYMGVRITTQTMMFADHLFAGRYLDMDFMDEHSKRTSRYCRGVNSY